MSAALAIAAGLRGWVGRAGAARSRERPRPAGLARPARARGVAADGEPRGLDMVLLAAVLVLLGMGIVMVYSASAVYAVSRYHDGMYFLKRHALFALMGLGALYVGWRVDYRLYRLAVYPILLTSILLLVALLVPGLGTRIDGATRWFRLGGISFQPSELAKIALVFYLAHSLARKGDQLRTFLAGFMPPLLVSGLIAALTLKQPDLGSTAVMMTVAMVMMLVGGTRVSHVVCAALAGAPIAYQQIVGTPWRLRRVIAFLDPWSYRKDVGYQISESLISVGSGGLSGLGLGAGKQKLFFLPAAHTDFVFAITGEELGFVGLAVVVALFAIVLARGVRAALGASDLFGTYVAFGLIATLSLQAAFHMAVVLGLVPTKGITLPFFSYGGSGLLFNLFSCGVLLNIAARKPQPTVVETLRRRIARSNRRRGQRVTVAASSGLETT